MNEAVNTNNLDERIFAIVQKELTTQRRTVQRLALLGAVVMTGIVTALWLTEPRPLPLRLHLSFAAMSALGVSWVFILGNILVRKNCPMAWDRIATAWVGLIGGIGFAIGATVVCLMRSEPIAGIVFAILGATFTILSCWNVRKAYHWQSDLRQRIISAENSHRLASSDAGTSA